MERLPHQQTADDRTNLPSILSTIAARRHSIFGHIRRQSDSASAHKELKLAVNVRSGAIPHHGWNRPAGRPRTSWISERSCRTPDLSLHDAAIHLFHGLPPTTGQHERRHAPQLIMRSSE